MRIHALLFLLSATVVHCGPNPVCSPGCLNDRTSRTCPGGIESISTCSAGTTCNPSTFLCASGAPAPAAPVDAGIPRTSPGADAPAETRACPTEGAVTCSSLRSGQVLICRGGQWTEQRSCAAGEVCSAGTCLCEDAIRCATETAYQRCDRSTRQWSSPRECPPGLRCDPTRESGCADECAPRGGYGCRAGGEVWYCGQRGLSWAWMFAGVNCERDGLGMCQPPPSSPITSALDRDAAAQHCVNVCGGRGARLAGSPGGLVPASSCARWYCDAASNRLLPDRSTEPAITSCLPTGAPCTDGRQCVSGVCGGGVCTLCGAGGRCLAEETCGANGICVRVR